MIRAFEKREGEMIPHWWAVAYRDFDRDVAICYPIPLHLIIRWLRDIRHWFMHIGRPGYAERREHELFMAGYRAKADSIDTAFDAGRAEGFQEGRKDAFASIAATLKEDADRRAVEAEEVKPKLPATTP